MKTKIPVTWIVLLGLMTSITLGVLLEEPKTVSHSTFVFGSAHEHASISIKIFEDGFDLTKPEFQLQSPFIHLENSNGYVIHRHSKDVAIGYFFETLNLGLTPDCFTIDDGRKFCTNDDYSLKFYVNERQVDDIRDYIIFEGDYILISYGSETQEEIKKQFKEQKERGFPFQLRERNGNNLSNV
jgi:hypothetical protein